MKKETKNKKLQKRGAQGITLIALVITIIVLLILAAVSISMLTGENGLLTKASLAKDNTRAGGIQEEIDLAVAQNEIYNYSEGSKTTRDGLIEKLHDENRLTDDEYNKLMGLNGETKVDLITIGTITVDFSKLNVKDLQIGDVVTAPGLATFAGNEWIYFGKDSSGNNLVTTSGTIANGFTFNYTAQNWLVYDLKSGDTGYDATTDANNINKACAKLYADNGGTVGEARSITLEDINKVTGFTEPSFREYTFIGGDTNNYASDEVNYYYPDAKGADRTLPNNVAKYFVKAGETLNEETIPIKKFKCNSYYYYKDGENYKLCWEGTSKNWEEENTTLTNPDKMKYVIGESNNLDYAVASRSVYVAYDNSDFRVDYVGGGGVYSDDDSFCNSDSSSAIDRGGSYAVPVRPVVSLGSGVNLVKK